MQYSNHPLTILADFIKRPTVELSDLRRKDLIIHIFAYVFFGITLTIITHLVINIFFGSNNQIDNNNISLSYNEIRNSIQTVLIASVVEEVIFRGLIAKATEKMRRFYLFCFLFMLVYQALLFAPITNNVPAINIVYFVIAVIPILVIIVFFLPTRLINNKKVFTLLVYLSAFVFSLSHITNYNVSNNSNYLLLPFYLMNQLYLGFVTAYLASRYSLYYAILAHFLNNFIVIFVTSGLVLNNMYYEKYIYLSFGVFTYLVAMFFFAKLTAQAYLRSKSNNFDNIIEKINYID